jgi:photosystem II stability/assembly factor-like uncharacterized protein
MLFGLLLAVGGARAAEPTVLLNGIAHQSLFAASFDGANGYAVGARGQIVASADSGKTWKTQASPKPLGLLGVVAKAGHVIAVGLMGTALTSSGDGKWQAVDTGGAERLLAVDMNSKGLAIATGSFGTVLRSTDFGASWTAAKPDWKTLFAADAETLGENFGPHLYATSVAEDGAVLIAGELSTILRSTDGGLNWTVVNKGALKDGIADPSVFSLRQRADGVGLAVGQSGQILRSTDRGGHWAPVDSGTQAILLGIDFDAAGNAVVPGMREMLRSTDGGQHWQPLRGADFGNSWYSGVVAAAGAPGVLVVGQSGRILSVPE